MSCTSDHLNTFMQVLYAWANTVDNLFQCYCDVGRMFGLHKSKHSNETNCLWPLLNYVSPVPKIDDGSTSFCCVGDEDEV